MFTNSHRYSFQGQEHDDEVKGKGNSINYKYRMHDPRVGRFFAVDPLADEYPHNSPYAFSENNVIHAIELEGLEKVPLTEIWNLTDPYTTASVSYYEDLGGASIDGGGAFKVATINDVAVRLYEIKKGPNKGNYYGAAFTSKSTAMSGEGLYQWEYIVGKDLVSDNWNSGELGPVSQSSAIGSWGNDFEFSSKLLNVRFNNEYGVGEYSKTTGNWVSGSMDEQWDGLLGHWKDAWTEPMNLLPSPINMKFKLKTKFKWGQFKKSPGFEPNVKNHPTMTNRQVVKQNHQNFEKSKIQDVDVDPVLIKLPSKSNSNENN